jgi:hypothetical protein
MNSKYVIWAVICIGIGVARIAYDLHLSHAADLPPIFSAGMLILPTGFVLAGIGLIVVSLRKS